MAIGRVKYWVLGFFEGVLVGVGGSTRFCLTPIKTFLAPLEALYDTRFGSRHHIMVQLAYVNRVGITDPLSDLWSSHKGYNISRNKIWNPRKFHNTIYLGSKLHFTCGDHPDGAFWTKSRKFGPSGAFSWAKRPDSGLFGASKGRYLPI